MLYSEVSESSSPYPAYRRYFGKKIDFFLSVYSEAIKGIPLKKAPPLVPNRNITRGGFLIIWGFLKFNYIPKFFAPTARYIGNIPY